MQESVAGTSGDFPDADDAAERELGTKRAFTTRYDYERAMFLGRLVVGFTILAALTFVVVAIVTGENYAAIPVGLLLFLAAGGYYRWMKKSLQRDLELNPDPDHDCDNG